MPKDMAGISETLNYLVGDNNPSIIRYERLVAEITNSLEETTAVLRSAKESLAQEENRFNGINNVLPQLKNDLEPLTLEKYQEFLNLINSSYDFSQMSNEISEDAENILSESESKIGSYKSKIDEMEVKIKELTADLKSAQEELMFQRALKEKLETYMASAKTDELSLSKKEMLEFLRKFTDENGEQLFAEDELPLAAQMVMFSENFDLNARTGKTMSDVIKEAQATNLDEATPLESIEEFEPLQNIEPFEFDRPIEPKEEIVEQKVPKLELPSNISISYNPLKEEKVKMPIEEEPKEEYSLSNPYDLMLDGTTDEKTPEDEKIVDFAPEEYDLKTPSLNEELYRENGIDPKKVSKVAMSFGEEETKRFIDNIKYLESIGLKGDVYKYPVTLYTVTRRDIEEALALANRYGITVKDIGDIVKLCSSKNANLAFSSAVEKYGPDYETAAKNSSPCKIINSFSNLKNNNADLTEYIADKSLLASLTGPEPEGTSSPAAYIAMTGILDKLESFSDKTAYAYVIDGIYFDKSRVETNLNKILAADPEASNEDILLAALAYGSNLTSEQVKKVAEVILPTRTFERMAA
ncbi:MAG TPA: hypothetical protein PLX66_03435 [Bacilli bacterium]|nr:hypothetical protein [Bacilli bacterium]